MVGTVDTVVALGAGIRCTCVVVIRLVLCFAHVVLCDCRQWHNKLCSGFVCCTSLQVYLGPVSLVQPSPVAYELA